MKINKFLLLALIIVFNLDSLYGQSVLFPAKEKGKKYGYINEQGTYVISPTFDEAGAFYQGIAVVRQGKKTGVINTTGEFIINPIYDDADFYAPEGMVSVKKDGKWGVIDRSGKIIIPLAHEYISVFINGYVVTGKYVTNKGYSGILCPTVLNEKNEVIFTVGQQSASDIESGFHYDCTQLFLPGYANKKNNAYSKGWPMVREGILVLKEALEGDVEHPAFRAVDVRTGKAFTFNYGLKPTDDSFAFREGTMAMEIPADIREENSDTRMGFYDTASFATGNMEYPIFDTKDQRVHPFFNGVAAIEKDGRWMFINRDSTVAGETQLSTKEYRASPPMYFNGLIAFWKNGKVGFVDITGKEVIPFTLEEYHPFEYDVTPVKQNGLFGLIRKDGTWTVAPKFEYLGISVCPCFH